MTSPWTALDRPPLSQRRLQRDLGHGPVWREISVLARADSTNAVAAAAARSGAAEGLVVVAEEQTAGRGRLGRSWTSPPRSGLLLSAVLRPGGDATRWPLLSLLTALSVADAVGADGTVQPVLKWPNDVLVGDRKLAGILAERVQDAVVVGIGCNVSLRAEELPLPSATSLAIEGGPTDREVLLKRVLRALAARYLTWQGSSAGAATLLPAYREVCATIGTEVALSLPDGTTVRGRALDVDETGRLVLMTSDGARTAWSAGDVTHLRAAPADEVG